MLRVSLCLVCMDLAITALAIAQSADVGLTFAQDNDVGTPNNGTAVFSALTQTAQMTTTDTANAVFPLAIAVTSTLPNATTLVITASSPQDWLKITLSNDSATCPDMNSVTYLNSVDLDGFSGTIFLCVLATGMPNVSVYNGLLTFQTQAGATFIPVTYSVFPPAYLHVSIIDSNQGTYEIGGLTLGYSGKQTVNLQIAAQSNNPPSPPPTFAVDIALVPQANWLTFSPNTLTELPGSLKMTVDTSKARPGASTMVQLLGTDGGGEVDFTVKVVTAAFPAIWRPTDGSWWLARPYGPSGFARQWGLQGDVPVPADYDSDGQVDFAVWRNGNGTWYIWPSNGDAQYTVQWGLPDDIPVPADYDGDGKVDFAVWRKGNGTWYISPGNGGPDYTVQWGLPDDIPVPADYDGDGEVDFAVWRPREAKWYIKPSRTPGTPIVQQWGLSDDKPVPADYDGDGKADLAVWREKTATWYIWPSNGGAKYTVQWGLPHDKPVPADYDGDGKADFAVWRPSNATWYIIQSTNPSVPISRQWGLERDMPLTKAPLEKSAQPPQ